MTISPELFSPFATTLFVAEASHLLASTATLNILFKSNAQRTEGERKRVRNGLLREFLSAALLFIPVSAALASILLKPLAAKYLAGQPTLLDAFIGLISYGFPYAAVRTWALHFFVRLLKESLAVADKAVAADFRK